MQTHISYILGLIAGCGPTRFQSSAGGWPFSV